jgi:hypothetical protein
LSAADRRPDNGKERQNRTARSAVQDLADNIFDPLWAASRVADAKALVKERFPIVVKTAMPEKHPMRWIADVFDARFYHLLNYWFAIVIYPAIIITRREVRARTDPPST